MKVPSFNEFISEAVENPKLVIITDEPEQAKTFHTADRLQQEAKKLGWKYYLYNYYWEMKLLFLLAYLSGLDDFSKFDRQFFFVKQWKLAYQESLLQPVPSKGFFLLGLVV